MDSSDGDDFFFFFLSLSLLFQKRDVLCASREIDKIFLFSLFFKVTTIIVLFDIFFYLIQKMSLIFLHQLSNNEF